MIQELHSLIFTQMSWNLTFTQKPIHEALFITYITWKQPKYPSIGERINKLSTLVQWNIIQWLKEIRHGETLHA